MCMNWLSIARGHDVYLYHDYYLSSDWWWNSELLIKGSLSLSCMWKETDSIWSIQQTKSGRNCAQVS